MLQQAKETLIAYCAMIVLCQYIRPMLFFKLRPFHHNGILNIPVILIRERTDRMMWKKNRSGGESAD